LIKLCACRHVGGGIVSATPPTFNAMHPNWRTSLSDVSFFGAWNDLTPQSTIKTIRQQVSDLLKPLRDLTPGGGQYLNEVRACFLLFLWLLSISSSFPSAFYHSLLFH
jgi:hypothetical protein